VRVAPDRANLLAAIEVSVIAVSVFAGLSIMATSKPSVEVVNGCYR